MIFKAMIKKLKLTLLKWSRSTFGNLFLQVAKLEEAIRVKEIQFEINVSAQNTEELSRVNAKLKRYYHYEEF